MRRLVERRNVESFVLFSAFVFVVCMVCIVGDLLL